ncbi:MAG: CRISPR-associated ring nuclease [Sutterella wadsworthensis]
MPAEMNSRRCILLAVTGMTPQVITETIYALKTERNIVPDEVHVVTTSSGADCIRETLLDPSCGRWQSFVKCAGCQQDHLLQCGECACDSNCRRSKTRRHSNAGRQYLGGGLHHGMRAKFLCPR